MKSCSYTLSFSCFMNLVIICYRCEKIFPVLRYLLICSILCPKSEMHLLPYGLLKENELERRILRLLKIHKLPMAMPIP